MKNIREIIDDMGGPSYVARYIGVYPGTITAWMNKNAVPAWQRMALRKMAEAEGLPLPDFSKTTSSRLSA